MTSTRFLHRTLFLTTHLISAKVFFTPLASSSPALRHVFFGLPLLGFPWRFHSRACQVMSSIGFRSVWPSHPHLRFLICKSILGCFDPTNIGTEYFKHDVYCPFFSSSKCSLFHNSDIFGSRYSHFINRMCQKKIIPATKG